MIQPAKSVKRNMERNQLSAEEMKLKLQDHFHKSGTLSSLKTQLRSHLVTELFKVADSKNKITENSLPDIEIEKSLLPLQVSNWLVYEHLRQQGYAYTLSTFVSEANISAPETLLSVQDILELIGLNKQSVEHVKIIKAYYTKSEKESLLHSVLTSAIKCYILYQNFLKESHKGNGNIAGIKDDVSSPPRKLYINKSVPQESINKQSFEISEDKKVYFNYNGNVQAISSAEQLQDLYQQILSDKKMQENEIFNIRQKLLQEFDNIYQHEQEVRLQLEQRRKRFVEEQDRFDVLKSKLKAKELELERRSQLMEEELEERIKIKTESIAPFLQVMEEELRKEKSELKQKTEKLEERKSFYESQEIELDEMKNKLQQLECRYKILQNKYSFLLSEKTELCNKLESFSDYEVIKVELSHKSDELEISKKKIESIKLEAKLENEKLRKLIENIQKEKEESIIKKFSADKRSIGVSTETFQLQESVRNQQREKLEQELGGSKEAYKDILNKMEDQKSDIQELHRTIHIWHDQFMQNRSDTKFQTVRQCRDVSSSYLPIPSGMNCNTENRNKTERRFENHQPVNVTIPKASNFFLYHPAVQLRHYYRDEPVKFITEAKKRINILQEEAHSLERKYSELVASHPITRLQEYSPFVSSSNITGFSNVDKYSRLDIHDKPSELHNELYNLPSFILRTSTDSKEHETIQTSKEFPNSNTAFSTQPSDKANFKHLSNKKISTEVIATTSKDVAINFGRIDNLGGNFASGSHTELYNNNHPFASGSYINKSNLLMYDKYKSTDHLPGDVAEAMHVGMKEMHIHNQTSLPPSSEINSGAFNCKYNSPQDLDCSDALISAQKEKQLMPLYNEQNDNDESKLSTHPKITSVSLGSQANNVKADHLFHIKKLSLLAPQDSLDKDMLPPRLGTSCQSENIFKTQTYLKTANEKVDDFKKAVVCPYDDKTEHIQNVQVDGTKLTSEEGTEQANERIKESSKPESCSSKNLSLINGNCEKKYLNDNIPLTTDMNKGTQSKIQFQVENEPSFERYKILFEKQSKIDNQTNYETLEISNPSYMNDSPKSSGLEKILSNTEAHQLKNGQIYAHKLEKCLPNDTEIFLPSGCRSTSVDQSDNSAAIQTRHVSIDLDAAWKKMSEPISKITSFRHSLPSSIQSSPKKCATVCSHSSSGIKFSHDNSTKGNVKSSDTSIPTQNNIDSRLLKEKLLKSQSEVNTAVSNLHNSHNENEISASANLLRNHKISQDEQSREGSTDTMERIPMIDSDSGSDKQSIKFLKEQESSSKSLSCPREDPDVPKFSTAVKDQKTIEEASDILVPPRKKLLDKSNNATFSNVSKETNHEISSKDCTLQHTRSEDPFIHSELRRDIFNQTVNKSDVDLHSETNKLSTVIMDNSEGKPWNNADIQYETKNGVFPSNAEALTVESKKVKKDDLCESSVSELSELHLSVGSDQLEQQEKDDDFDW